MSKRPTTWQMVEFWKLVGTGHIDRIVLQEFLRSRGSPIIEVEYRLRYGSDVISRLVEGGQYAGYRDYSINDGRFSFKRNDTVRVQFHFVLGQELNPKDEWIKRSEVEFYFRSRGMRLPNAAEALVPPCMEKSLGRKDCNYIAFIEGSTETFIVSEVDDRGEKKRSLESTYNYSSCPASFVFAGVYSD